MNGDKISKFMKLAGQSKSTGWEDGSAEQRKLGAQLLLSETLEYVIKGLGVTPVVNGSEIKDPDALNYETNGSAPDKIEVLDGLSDVAYTMYWNAHAFGIPLEEAFDVVCDNNLEKFVKLDGWQNRTGELEQEHWNCERGIEWPKEVESVTVVDVEGEHYAVGKDGRGKVRKPSCYRPVDLSPFVGKYASQV